MSLVIIEKKTFEELNTLEVFSWGVWTKEPSEFDWYYDCDEMCYILEGDVTIQTSDESFLIKKGDFVTFKKGLKCVWKIRETIKKHYKF